MKRVRVGIVGVGKMGELHLQKYLANPHAEVVGFFDSDERRSHYVTQRYGVPSFAAAADMYFEIDAASVASHTNSHYANCKQALESGVSVLVEKPMCDHLEQASHLNDLAKKNGLVLQVGYLERLRLRRFLAHVKKSDVRYLDFHWFATELPREASIDVIGDLLVHPLDLTLSLMDDEPVGWKSRGDRVITSSLDQVHVRIEFARGGVANLWASRVAPQKERRLYFLSGECQATLNFITNHVDILQARNGMISKTGFVLNDGQPLDVLYDQCAAFVSAVGSKAVPVVTGDDAIHVLRLTEQIRESMGAFELEHRDGTVHTNKEVRRDV